MERLNEGQLANYRLTMEGIHRTFDKHLYLPTWWLIDVVCATMLANWIEEGPPIWLAIIGPASSAKTVMIESLEGIKGVYPMGGLSDASLTSGTIGRRGRPRTDGTRAYAPSSVLEEISEESDWEKGIFHSSGTKFFTFKDFTTMLSLKHETKTRILGTLREVYDGHVSWRWSGKKMDWYGKVATLVACTSEWDSAMVEFSHLGERFLQWRIPRQGLEASMAVLRQKKGLMKDDLQIAMKKLYEMRVVKDLDISSSHKWLVDLGDKTAIIRQKIKKDRFTKQALDMADPESGQRLTEQLAQLMKGMMLVKGTMDSEDPDVRYPVARAAYSSLPRLRIEIMSRMEGETLLTGMKDNLRTPRSTVQRAMDDLMMLRVVDKPAEGIYEVREEWKDYQRMMGEVWERVEKEKG